MTTGTTRSAARRSRFSFVWTFARTAVSLTLFAILLSQIDLNAALAAVAGARLDLLMLLLLAFVLDRVIATYRWYLLLRHRSSRVSYGGVLSLVLVSGFVGYFIPGGLGVDVLRAYGMARTTSDPLLSVSSVLVERLFGFVALALLILLGLVLQPPGLPVAIAHYAWAGLALVAGLVLALMTTQFRRLTLGLIGTIRLARMRGYMQKFYGALDDYARQRRLMLWSLVIALLFQLLRCLQPAIGAAALGVPLPLAVFLTVVPLVVLIALLPISLAGLGLQDISYVYLFGLAGMPIEIALALSLLIHIFILLATVPGAWLYARAGLHS